MSPVYATGCSITAWALSWWAAALWSRRTTARPSSRDQLVHLVPTVIGAGLVASGAQARMGGRFHPFGEAGLWRLTDAAGWVLFGVCLAGLAFCWWARLTLGDLWSGTVNRKEGHVVIQSGPYRFVRHPIYTGLILALAAFAVELSTAAALIGVVFISFGFWLKARLEERFLSQQLGEAAYADYRRRTPMLVPFWPVRG